MPAGSGHDFVFAFPEGKAARIAPGQDDGRAAHRADAILARACSFLTLLVYDRARRSRISRSAEGLTAGHTEATQGAALDLQGASPLTHNPWQRSIGDTSPREGRKDFSQLSRERKRWNFICAIC